MTPVYQVTIAIAYEGDSNYEFNTEEEIFNFIKLHRYYLEDVDVRKVQYLPCPSIYEIMGA